VTDHQAIDELLAGYALRSLSGPDAREAERLLTEHVPACATCRDTLAAFGAVAADLALAAPGVSPPDTLLPRLHRSLGPRGGRTGRALVWSPGRIVAAAASVVLVVGLGGIALTGGSSTPQLASSSLADALAAAGRSDATTTDLTEVTEVDVPGMQAVFVYGEHVPAAPAGSEYRVWLVQGGTATDLGSFAPLDDGSVALRIEVDPSSFERILVTVEPVGSIPSAPGEPAWQAAA
jgi:anti-sigma-K factor RskA